MNIKGGEVISHNMWSVEIMSKDVSEVFLLSNLTVVYESTCELMKGNNYIEK